MTEDEKYIAEAAARKKLFGYLIAGVLLTIAGLAAPAIFARFHPGHTALANRLQWRLSFTGLALSGIVAFALYKFRRGYDRK